MKRKKIIIISISLVITIIFAIFGGFLGLILSRNAQLNTIDFSEITGSSKKVVLFIGDGMGVNHVKATSSYYEKQMFMTSLEYQGMVSTFSNSLSNVAAFDKSRTDKVVSLYPLYSPP